ncbi:MAG: hypothetical protein AAGF11_08085, partial [Myxococcota bacterium]
MATPSPSPLRDNEPTGGTMFPMNMDAYRAAYRDMDADMGTAVGMGMAGISSSESEQVKDLSYAKGKGKRKNDQPEQGRGFKAPDPPLRLVLSRLSAWLRLILRLTGSMLLRRLLRRTHTPQQQAEHLRMALQSMGPIVARIGRLLAMRLDLLPAEFAHEFSKLDDRTEPIDINEAVERIEVAAGAPLYQVYRAFDPEPIA